LISKTNTTSGMWRIKQFMQKLGKKPNSKNMDLNNCALDATDLMELGEALETIPHLEELDLSWNNNIGGKLSLLTKRFQTGCKIKILKFTDCSLTTKDGESLAEVLNVLHDLEVLDISFNRNIGCSLKSIAQELKNVPVLKELNLHMCGLKKDSFQYLGRAFQYLPELNKLDLSCNKEIGGGFKDSATHLASFKDLEVLDLHRCCVTEEDMVVLTETALHLPELEILDLSWNKCVGGNLKLLLEALKLATEIRTLRLSSCNLVAEDLTLLALEAQGGHLAKLQKLDLSYNDTVSDEGWATFFQGLTALKELSELDVSLRPSSCRDCGMWFSKLLTDLSKLPAFTEIGMQRWALLESQQRQMESFNQNTKRNVHFDY
ncbi:Leucine-rich repeat-containing protein 31, partial [Chelonia mydas]